MAHAYTNFPPNGPVDLSGRPLGVCACGRWADSVDLVLICPNATIQPGPKKTVSFDNVQEISVNHWQRAEIKKVHIPLSATDVWVAFQANIVARFGEEIGNNSFRIYKLPHNFNDFDERQRIDTSDDFENYLKEYAANLMTGRPQLYVWNVENTTPDKPTKDIIVEETLSRETRNTNQPGITIEDIKTKDIVEATNQTAVGDTTQLIQEFKKMSVSFEKSVKEIPSLTAELIRAEPTRMKASDAGSDHFKKLLWTEFALNPAELDAASACPEYESTLAQVKIFSNDIASKLISGQTSDIKNVQIPTSTLIANLVPIFFPGTNATMEREYAYESIIVEGQSKTFDVLGKIDISIVVGDTVETPMFAVENKTMNLKLVNKNPRGECAKALCQSAYNLKCIFQKCHESYSISIPFIIGALTNGLQWIFVSLESTTKPKFSRTVTINSISEDGIINDDSVALIAKYLVKALSMIKRFVAQAQLPQTPAAAVSVVAPSSSSGTSASKKNISALKPSNKGKANSSSMKSTGIDNRLSKASELNKENLLKLFLYHRKLG